MCLQIPQIPPPTEEAQKQVKNLKTLLYCQIGLAFLFLILGVMNKVFNCVIMAFLLYMIYSQLSVCGCIFYTFYTLFDLATYFSVIGASIQNNSISGFLKGGISAFIAVFLFMFSVISVYFVFKAYKEFKAIWKEGFQPDNENQRMGNFFPPPGQSNVLNNNQAKQNFKAFQGHGVTLSQLHQINVI